MLTRCLSAICLSTPSNSWKRAHPPHASIRRLYTCKDAVLSSPRCGSGRPRHFTDDPARHRARMWHPFRACLNFRKAFPAPRRGEFLSKFTGEVFGCSVMIGEVPRRKAAVMIDGPLFDGLLGLDVAGRAGYPRH